MILVSLSSSCKKSTIDVCHIEQIFVLIFPFQISFPQPVRSDKETVEKCMLIRGFKFKILFPTDEEGPPDYRKLNTC